MKTALDPRHQNRRDLIRRLYAWSINPGSVDSKSKTLDIVNQLEKVDGFIVVSAPEWPLDKINKIDLAILRLGVFEFINNKNTSKQVIIDEAIELAKEFGSESSPGFINGVLANVVAKIR